jgi:hypothetical protein
MKKLFVILLLATVTFAANAQGLFHKVTPAIFTVNQKALPLGKTMLLANGTSILSGVTKWRIDATFAFSENIYHKDIKQWVSNPFGAIGPAISLQHYVPTSITDPTPYNNWGIGAGVAAGVNILQPSFSSVKFIVEGNILQFIKGGFTATLNTKNWFGYFVGTGITF